MEPIQVIGMDTLDDTEQGIANGLIKSYYEKIVRLLKNEVSLKVHLKAHTKGGKRKKYDIRAQVLAPTSIFETQESDWDLAKSIHSVMKNMEREIEHKIKSG